MLSAFLSDNNLFVYFSIMLCIHAINVILAQYKHAQRTNILSMILANCKHITFRQYVSVIYKYNVNVSVTLSDTVVLRGLPPNHD